MLTPRFFLPAVLFSVFAAPAFAANFTLTGTQADAALVMSKGNTYTIKGDYVVPVGKKLEIGPGAVINAEKGSGITVKGELLVNADEKAPAIAKGKSWKGLHAVEDSKSSVTGLQVGGAEIGLHIEGTVDMVKACVFAKNATGLKLNGKGKVAVENCLIVENTSDGMRFTGMGGTITGCSFLRNKGFGLTVGEASPKLEKCLFTDNVGAGIEQSNASGSTGMNGTECAFEGKGFSIQSSIAHGSLDFQKCYWGDKATTYLKAKGESKGAVPNLKDARAGSSSLKVYLNGFLWPAPKPCGATVASKL